MSIKYMNVGEQVELHRFQKAVKAALLLSPEIDAKMSRIILNRLQGVVYLWETHEYALAAREVKEIELLFAGWDEVVSNELAAMVNRRARAAAKVLAREGR